MCPRACPRLLGWAHKLEGLVSASFWWARVDRCSCRLGFRPLGVWGFWNPFDTSFFSTQGFTAEGPSTGAVGSALLPTPLSPSLLCPLLPDGKNQLLLALLKCTGEGFGGATSACPGEAVLAGVILPSAQGGLFCRPVLAFPWSSGPARGKSNFVAPSASQNHGDLTSSSCAQATSLRALEPAALSLAISRAWLDLDEDTGWRVMSREAPCP